MATINFVPDSMRLLNESGSYWKAATTVLIYASTRVQYYIHTYVQ